MSIKEADIGYPNFDTMYRELNKAGYPNIKDFNNSNAFTEKLLSMNKELDTFIDIVVKWIPKIEYKPGGITLLADTKTKYDGRIIIPIFENDSAPNDRWRLCDAIVRNPPLNINEWVRDTYLSKKYSYAETGLLPLAIVKIFPNDEARAILKKGFNHHYRVTPEAFGKIGKKEDIPFLEKKLLKKYDSSHVYKDIEKALIKIKKRENV